MRVAVPLYSSRAAVGYLDATVITFASWVKGYRRDFAHRPPVEGAPLVTGLPPEVVAARRSRSAASRKGMFLSALRRAGIPLQQIRPMLDLVRTKLGIEHALASRRLYVVGAQLLWEVSTEDDVDEEVRHTARDLIVLRDGQYVFRQVIEQYLRQITYDDEYARRLELPRYEVAHIVTDPEVNFGKPYFAHSGTPLAVVRDLLRAGRDRRGRGGTTSASRSTRSPSSPSASGCSRRDRPAARAVPRPEHAGPPLRPGRRPEHLRHAVDRRGASGASSCPARTTCAWPTWWRCSPRACLPFERTRASPAPGCCGSPAMAWSGSRCVATTPEVPRTPDAAGPRNPMILTRFRCSEPRCRTLPHSR